jgi:hypothetical protein
MTPTEWLRARAREVDGLSAREVDAVLEFVLLWSYFEGRALGARASPPAVRALAERWALAGRLDTDPLAPYLAYFRGHYFRSGVPTRHLPGLRLELLQRNRHELRARVEAVLQGENNDPIDGAEALLLVLYRLRSNLFHGAHWVTEQDGQSDSLEYATAALIAAVELHEDGRVTYPPPPLPPPPPSTPPAASWAVADAAPRLRGR